jgi:hypothetical protein
MYQRLRLNGCKWSRELLRFDWDPEKNRVIFKNE